jgi:hypothetical protein
MTVSPFMSTTLDALESPWRLPPAGSLAMGWWIEDVARRSFFTFPPSLVVGAGPSKLVLSAAKDFDRFRLAEAVLVGADVPSAHPSLTSGPGTAGELFLSIEVLLLTAFLQPTSSPTQERYEPPPRKPTSGSIGVE